MSNENATKTNGQPRHAHGREFQTRVERARDACPFHDGINECYGAIGDDEVGSIDCIVAKKHEIDRTPPIGFIGNGTAYTDVFRIKWFLGSTLNKVRSGSNWRG